MDNLVCTECGTTYYSAAAATMIRRDERCDCGGRLRLVHGAEVPVGGPQPPPVNGTTLPPGRRFARD
jgi:hypothetical protein